jgi:hypothetical protein
MPVSGWWLPIVMLVAVIPGAEAVSFCEPPPEPEPPPGEPDPLEPQAATSMATAASPAIGASVNLRDLFM